MSLIAERMQSSYSPRTSFVEPKLWATIAVREGFKISRTNESVVKICLDRPESGNSLSLSMVEEITHLIRELSTDHSVHQIMFTGTGKYFCTGMDIQEDLSASSSERYSALYDLFQSIDRCPKITIAAINGPAFGGGVGLAFVCDIRLATSSSFFRLSEVRLGLCPATITKYLVREWGSGLTRRAVITATKIEPQVLYNIGALHGIEPNLPALEGATEDLIAELKLTAPRASSWCKTLIQATSCSRGNDHYDMFARGIFKTMVAVGSESSYAIDQFKRGVRNICWASRREIFDDARNARTDR